MSEPSNGGPDEHGPVLKGKARHDWETTILRSVGKPGPNHVLHALLRYAGGKHECWPSNESLGLDLGLSARQVQKHLRDLVEEKVVLMIRDRSLKTQRRIVLARHPHAPRGVAHDTPALNAGVSPEVGAGVSSTTPETKYETKQGEGSSPKRGEGETDSDAQWRNPTSPIACVDSIEAEHAVDRGEVTGWATNAWLALAPGRECETVDDLVRIAAARDGVRLGLGAAEIESRREWVEAAIESMRAPAWPGDGGR